MKTTTFFCFPLLTTLLWLSIAADSFAQAPVSTSIGQTETGRAAAAAGKAGTITGRERFLRRNRRRTSFVGRDRTELSTFVGQQQGTTTGTVRSAVEGRRVRFQRNANITAQRTNETVRRIYEPRLTIRFDVRPIEPGAFEESLADLLNASSVIHRLGPISVRVHERTGAARTATLEGVVASDEDRRLAEAYLRFEPGLSNVVNRLTVASSPAAGSP